MLSASAAPETATRAGARPLCLQLAGTHSKSTGSRGLQRRTLRDNRGLASLVLRDLEGLVLPALGRLAEGASRLRGVHLWQERARSQRRASSLTGGPEPGYHERGNYAGTRFAMHAALEEETHHRFCKTAAKTSRRGEGRIMRNEPPLNVHFAGTSNIIYNINTDSYNNQFKHQAHARHLRRTDQK